MESARKITTCMLMLWLCLFFNGGLSQKKNFVSRLRQAQMHLQRQIDNLRTELKTEISMLREDMKILFDSEVDITTVVPEVRKKTKDKSFHGAKHDEGKAAQHVQLVVKAFGIEKKLNQKLRNELSALKESMTREIENQKIDHERDVAKVSAAVLKDIATWKENAMSIIFKETTNTESRCNRMYREVKNSIISFRSYQKEEFDNITAVIKANVEIAKSELNQRIRGVREVMQDDMNEYCTIPIASTNGWLNSTQSVIKDLSAKVGEALVRTHVLACNQGIESRLYNIYLQDTDETIPVDCYKKTDGGAWARIFMWDYRAESDYKDEEEYRKGFGRFGENYWLGFKNFSILTMNKGVQLRIELEGISYYVGTFEDFKVVKEGRNYRVYFGKFSGSSLLKDCFKSDVVPALFGNAMREKDWIPLTNCFVQHMSRFYWWIEEPDLDGCLSGVKKVEIYIR